MPTHTNTSPAPHQFKKLLRPKTGYAQHTSLNFPKPTVISNQIPNLLLQMKADAKSDYTINFTRKALHRIQQYAPLTQPEAVKAFIASLDVTDGS
jgi:hypothetical protein